MDDGDHCKADLGGFRQANDGELAIARSQTPQLPPNFIYRGLPMLSGRRWPSPTSASQRSHHSDVGDFCEADDGELATARSRTLQFPPL